MSSFAFALASATGSVLVSGCVALPDARSISCLESATPVIGIAEGGRRASVEIEVLTYNIEGLAWPARSGRREQLEQIAAQLAALRERGEAPHIVLFQEVFSKSAVRAAIASSYPSLVAGPGRRQSRPRNGYSSLPGKRRPDRGELGLKLLSGGLVIASEFPIVSSRSEPFPRRSCAGIDCLANKGVLGAEIAIPSVPGTLVVVNTHMNAQRASRVGSRRHNAAHARQVQALSTFLAEAALERPVVFGGDFNMRGSHQRFEVFETGNTLRLVHRYCAAHEDLCEVELSWDGDAPWMDTQDLQLFSSGSAVAVRPVRIEAMFDGASEAKLSDHDGLRVTYELSWSVDDDALPAAPCP